MKRLLAVILLGCLLCGGCAAKFNHPNAINQFDDKAFDVMLAAQASILDAKTHISEHPEAKEVLNQAIAAYDAALPAYKAYHSIGANDSSAKANLDAALIGLSASIAQLEQAFGHKLGGN